MPVKVSQMLPVTPCVIGIAKRQRLIVVDFAGMNAGATINYSRREIFPSNHLHFGANSLYIILYRG